MVCGFNSIHVLFLMFLAPLYCYVFPINTYALEPPEIYFDVI